MKRQLQIRFLFREQLLNNAKLDQWSHWINCVDTARDADFIKVVIKDTNIIYHSVSDVSSFETRILVTEEE